MAKALIGLGALMIGCAFLLAFTVYGEIAALVGTVGIAAGSMMLGRRSSPGDTRPPNGPF